MVMAAEELSRAYLRRDPGSGVLYEVLASHLETFLARSVDDPATPGLPRHVRRELRAYLRCGILAHGFARFHCFRCGTDALVAFSCKGRGFCPSCGGRRMAESAAHLVDHVFPEVPVRQWVVSFPWVIRYLLARRPSLCRAVRRVFLRAVFGFYRRRVRDEGLASGRTGAVNRIQRFGSALNLNVHFHALVLDGVYTAASPFASPVFHEASELCDDDVERLVETIHARVLRLLHRRGFLSDEGEVLVGEEEKAQGLLPLLQAASIQGRVAQGPAAGARLGRLGRPSTTPARFVPGSLCAEVDGFSLHAGVWVGAHERERLEHLCRYVARPPFAAGRLKWSRRGRVLYELRRPWRDGTTHIVFEPMELIERLAALVPPPRMHQQTYHGVLAPGASWRDEVVVGKGCAREGSEATDAKEKESVVRAPHRYLWAELMRRVFGLDVLRCEVCGAKRRLVSLIMERSVIVRILAHLGLETDPPPISPARAPPQLELGFE
jgi:hypothetical protein